MKIGDAAKKSGVPEKTIRYYEDIGLIPKASRTQGGYRDYGLAEVETLRFIQRARRLGFAVKDVAGLLTLWRDRTRASAEVKKLAHRHVAEIEAKMAEMDSVRRTLMNLIENCHGDHRPDCPILDDLAGQKSCHEPAPRSRK